MDRKRRARQWGLGALVLICTTVFVFVVTCFGQLHLRGQLLEGRYVHFSTTPGTISMGYQRYMFVSGVPFVGDRSRIPVWTWGTGPYTNGAMLPTVSRTSAGFEASIPAFLLWVPLGIASVLARKKQRRLANPSLCERCGYMTVGVSRCSECGAATTGA